MSGIRVAILDDAPYVAWDGRIHAANATFHRFAAALLEVADERGDPVVAGIVLAAPVRPATEAPGTLPVDERIRVVPTVPFEGIAGYLRRAPLLAARNLPRLRRAFAGADVVLLRLPASNGLLGALAAAARGTPRVAYVVGSVADVVAGQDRPGTRGAAARLVGSAYDAATRIAGAGAVRVVVGVTSAGEGIVSSLILPREIRDRGAEPWPAAPPAIRVAWAGRLARGKGVEVLLAALATLPDLDVRLDLLGDGPARAALEDHAIQLGIADRVRFAGYLAEREPYLAALGTADLFVTTSPAEGFPKVVLDAMAAGLPVVAVPAGGLAGLVDEGSTPLGAPILPVPAAHDPGAVADAIRLLVADPARAIRLRGAGRAFASAHTLPSEAARLAAILRRAARREEAAAAGRPGAGGPGGQ